MKFFIFILRKCFLYSLFVHTIKVIVSPLVFLLFEFLDKYFRNNIILNIIFKNKYYLFTRKMKRVKNVKLK